MRWTPRRLLPASDDGLARMVAAGNEEAFAALYDRYHQRLYRYCRSMLGKDEDAQDALQSTFAGAYAALAQGRRDAPMRPWLYRIAHNESVSVMRRRRPRWRSPRTGSRRPPRQPRWPQSEAGWLS